MSKYVTVPCSFVFLIILVTSVGCGEKSDNIPKLRKITPAVDTANRPQAEMIDYQGCWAGDRRSVTQFVADAIKIAEDQAPSEAKQATRKAFEKIRSIFLGVKIRVIKERTDAYAVYVSIPGEDEIGPLFGRVYEDMHLQVGDTFESQDGSLTWTIRFNPKKSLSKERQTISVTILYHGLLGGKTESIDISNLFIEMEPC